MAPVMGHLESCKNLEGDSPLEFSSGSEGISNAGAVLEDELLDSSLLRSVSASVLLHRVSSFRTDSGSISATQSDYKLSKVATQIHDFISHDWASSPWKKALTLLIFYNGKAAVLSSIGVAGVLSCLEWYFAGSLPQVKHEHHKVCAVNISIQIGTWSTLVCPFIFWGVLISWQKILSPCTTSRQLFVDKFCVDQVDEDRKTRAILGLAGFLNKSQCLVVCWTPRYFSRLWTVYEIASWHDLKGSHKDVLFLPLA